MCHMRGRLYISCMPVIRYYFCFVEQVEIFCFGLWFRPSYFSTKGFTTLEEAPHARAEGKTTMSNRHNFRRATTNFPRHNFVVTGMSILYSVTPMSARCETTAYLNHQRSQTVEGNNMTPADASLNMAPAEAHHVARGDS